MPAHTRFGLKKEARQTMVTFNRLIAAAVMTGVLYGPAAAQAPVPSAEQIRMRQQLATMETVLQRAIQIGAQNVITQVRSVISGGAPPRLGASHVSGFKLAGYGAVFHVQVPEFILPVMYEVLVREAQTSNAAMTIQQLRTQVSGMPPGPERARIEDLIFQLQTQLGTGGLRATVPQRGAVGAASLVPAGIERARGGSVDPAVVDDPEGAYTREVKAALIDAMLTNSQGLALGPDELLTVVARDGVPINPQFPTDSIDSAVWVMSVKGSVLTAFRSGSITKDEAFKQVHVTEQ